MNPQIDRVTLDEKGLHLSIRHGEKTNSVILMPTEDGFYAYVTGGVIKVTHATSNEIVVNIK